MKKIKSLILILIIMLAVGCGATTKEEINSDTVKVTLEKYNVSLVDVTSKFSFSDVAYYATKDSDKIKINYVKSIKKYDIQGIFLDECKNVYGKAGSSYKDKTEKGKNWANLTVTNSDNYYFVGWVGNAYIIVEAPIKNKTEMVNLVKELGFKS